MWFRRWLRRYAVFLRQPESATLLFSQSSVQQFCRTLLARAVPAWQRLQAVRAIEFYRNQVLETAEPDLLEIRQIFGRIAEGERQAVDSPTDKAELITCHSHESRSLPDFGETTGQRKLRGQPMLIDRNCADAALRSLL